MAKLVLHDLTCKEMEDYTGRDQVRIRIQLDGGQMGTMSAHQLNSSLPVDGDGYMQFDERDVARFTGAEVHFTNEIKIRLEEYDALDPIDDLGSHTLHAADSEGTQLLEFRSGAKYDLSVTLLHG